MKCRTEDEQKLMRLMGKVFVIVLIIVLIFGGNSGSDGRVSVMKANLFFTLLWSVIEMHVNNSDHIGLRLSLI